MRDAQRICHLWGQVGLEARARRTLTRLKSAAIEAHAIVLTDCGIGASRRARFQFGEGGFTIRFDIVETSSLSSTAACWSPSPATAPSRTVTMREVTAGCVGCRSTCARASTTDSTRAMASTMRADFARTAIAGGFWPHVQHLCYWPHLSTRCHRSRAQSPSRPARASTSEADSCVQRSSRNV